MNRNLINKPEYNLKNDHGSINYYNTVYKNKNPIKRKHLHNIMNKRKGEQLDQYMEMMNSKKISIQSTETEISLLKKKSTEAEDDCCDSSRNMDNSWICYEKMNTGYGGGENIISKNQMHLDVSLEILYTFDSNMENDQ